MQNTPENISSLLDKIYRAESRRIFASLIRLLGDFDLAEDALQDAFKAALEQWGEKGVPANPRAWLISTGRFKAIDRIRRQSKFDPLRTQQTHPADTGATDPSEQLDEAIEDDMLRLIFTCCHPALSLEARTAMALREVCELTTEEIARAFLTSPSTLAQRIVRAKAKIREAGIPFEVPAQNELPDRLESVLQVVYLIFNEGYYASSGASLTRVDLSGEAIRLGRLLHNLLPEPEVAGLLGLMLLHESRQPARTAPTGDLILLEEQNRRLWDQHMIREGLELVEKAFSFRQPGPYTLQAGIAALHAEARQHGDTNWKQISMLYDRLFRMTASPVIELNRAVANAMYLGPEEGLKQIDAILERGELHDYSLAHSARAEMCSKTGRRDEARNSWEQALALASQEPERRFIERKLRELGT